MDICSKPCNIFSKGMTFRTQIIFHTDLFIFSKEIFHGKLKFCAVLSTSSRYSCWKVFNTEITVSKCFTKMHYKKMFAKFCEFLPNFWEPILSRRPPGDCFWKQKGLTKKFQKFLSENIRTSLHIYSKWNLP